MNMTHVSAHTRSVDLHDPAQRREWFMDKHPQEGDEGWMVYYKTPIAWGQHKGKLSGWRGSGFTSFSIDAAKAQADAMNFGHIMIRKVRFTNHRQRALKEKYQMLSREWVKI
jgi:hypothetical protein